jgi:hypothetical protein
MARKSKIQNHGSDDKPGMRNNAFPSGPPAEEEYKVGPGLPPKEHQFKPGQSGNPKGAKPKARSLIPGLKELFERAFKHSPRTLHGKCRLVLSGSRGASAVQPGFVAWS